MSPKNYKLFERGVEALLLTLVLSAIAIVLMGVYAVADLVF